MGSSDLAGHLVASEQNGRRDLTGALTSRRLKLADLTALIGGAPRGAVRTTVTSPQQQAMAAKLTAEHRILPDARLDVARMRQMDADVRYTRRDGRRRPAADPRNWRCTRGSTTACWTIDPLVADPPASARSPARCGWTRAARRR